MSDIERRIKTLIAEKLSINEDSILPKAAFVEDLGADSLDTVELVMALEEEFGIEIPDADAEKIRNLADVLDYVARHQK